MNPNTITGSNNFTGLPAITGANYTVSCNISTQAGKSASGSTTYVGPPPTQADPVLVSVTTNATSYDPGGSVGFTVSVRDNNRTSGVTMQITVMFQSVQVSCSPASGTGTYSCTGSLIAPSTAGTYYIDARVQGSGKTSSGTTSFIVNAPPNASWSCVVESGGSQQGFAAGGGTDYVRGSANGETAVAMFYSVCQGDDLQCGSGTQATMRTEGQGGAGALRWSLDAGSGPTGTFTVTDTDGTQQTLLYACDSAARSANGDPMGEDMLRYGNYCQGQTLTMHLGNPDTNPNWTRMTSNIATMSYNVNVGYDPINYKCTK